ncbi:hypothetical protein APS67_004426 [Streptomyces sp. AVP053U2]|nr:hypothetical protein APS67_004426 [Streptomyces sp. AVP053U2]
MVAADASTVDELLERARTGYERIEAVPAREAARDGETLLSGIRCAAALHDRDGAGARRPRRRAQRTGAASRPSGAAIVSRGRPATGHDLRGVVVCDEGLVSGLAAEPLPRLELHRATGLVGGFPAWRAAGLPVRTQGTGPQYPPPSRNSVSSPSSSSARRTMRRARPSG